MFSLLRAGFAAALTAACLAVVCTCAAAASTKPFTDDDLATSAVQFEAQIKSDAGAPAKTADQLKRDADAAFAKNDFRTGMALLGQIVAAAPNDATTWLRLAQTILQIRPANDNERRCCSNARRPRPTSLISAPATATEEADSLAFLGTLLSQRQIWRPALDALRLSLELREVADVRGQYERMREHYGFRVLDYYRRCRHRIAARLFPVLRGSAGAHRFLAVRRGRRHRQAGAVGRPTSSFASKASARPDLYGDAARRPAVDGARDAVEDRRISPSMCATASPPCAFRASPMCCRAPGSTAFRSSASTRARSRSRSTASATAI